VALLRSLDWRRFQDLVTAMLARADYEVQAGPAFTDGSRILAAHWKRKLSARIFVAGWHRLRAGPSDIEQFSKAISANSGRRAVFITPGGFRSHTRSMAESQHIELVDGEQFLRGVEEVPLEEQRHLLRVLTAGEFAVPSCPQCEAKMVPWESHLAAAYEGLQPRFYTKPGTELENVRCLTLHLRRRAHVQFLRPVYAKEVIVEGRAVGNFNVAGRVTIKRGACLSGIVSARAINVEVGGLLDGEAVILSENELSPNLPRSLSQLWVCVHGAGCKIVLDYDRNAR